MAKWISSFSTKIANDSIAIRRHNLLQGGEEDGKADYEIDRGTRREEGMYPSLLAAGFLSNRPTNARVSILVAVEWQHIWQLNLVLSCINPKLSLRSGLRWVQLLFHEADVRPRRHEQVQEALGLI
jgi:hypothetical protein